MFSLEFFMKEFDMNTVLAQCASNQVLPIGEPVVEKVDEGLWVVSWPAWREVRVRGKSKRPYQVFKVVEGGKNFLYVREDKDIEWISEKRAVKSARYRAVDAGWHLRGKEKVSFENGTCTVSFDESALPMEIAQRL